MKRLGLTFAFLCVAGLAFGQHSAPGMDQQPAFLIAGLGRHHHPVSTGNPQAQRFFDQGMLLIYAFNHEEAIRSFQHAAELDPGLAMAHWGIALALGPNINLDVDPAREKAAYEAVRKAQALAVHAPEPECAYIEALAKRYTGDPKADLKRLAVDYKNAMGELSRRYPDDLDAATLYAESAMDLRPWQLWGLDGKPAEGTEEIVAVLESVLRRDPDHIGANHYYIHAVEASPHPEWGLAAAKRLETLTRAAGHLVHMPGHIYFRTGDYAGTIRVNEKAVAADRAYLQRRRMPGVYLMYYAHNYDFLRAAYGMTGQFREAKQAADAFTALVAPEVQEMPMLEYLMAAPALELVRFRRWEAILALPEPDRQLPIAHIAWHFARGMAYAGTGKPEPAEREHDSLRSAIQQIPADALWGLNSARTILSIAETVLSARIALARQDRPAAIALFRTAVAAQDAINYNEPPDWFYPIRESLGGALILNREYEAAEAVFRADLEKNPRNGRSLYGLRESLSAQGKGAEAGWVDREFQRAWQHAQMSLKVEDL